MKKLLLAVFLLLFCCGAHAADNAQATGNACFDPQNIFVDSIARLYSCVPIADHLCAQTCGDKTVSTNINTTIKDATISRTTIICGADYENAASYAQTKVVAVNGLTDGVFVQCNNIKAKVYDEDDIDSVEDDDAKDAQ